MTVNNEVSIRSHVHLALDVDAGSMFFSVSDYPFVASKSMCNLSLCAL